MIKKDFMSNVRDFKKQLKESKEKADKIEKEKVDSTKAFQRLIEESRTPRPLGLDEVSAAYISALRVSAWETLGDEFGGYKTGRILAYILSVLNERIEEFVSYTLNGESPLWEQCPIISSEKFKKVTTQELIKKTDEILEIIAQRLDSENTEEE